MLAICLLDLVYLAATAWVAGQIGETETLGRHTDLILHAWQGLGLLVGLGALVSKATRVTDAMLLAASRAYRSL